jgi:hypothetical protein
MFGRFAVLMVSSALVFLAILRWVLRRRHHQPNALTYAWITVVVVVVGMVLARTGTALGLPWWIYFGLPAALTWCLPPLALKMSTRETVEYIPFVMLMTPAIHIFFSLFFGWTEYLPFLQIPPLRQLLR